MTTQINFYESKGRIESTIPGIQREFVQKYAKTTMNSSIQANGGTKLLAETSIDRTVRIKNAKIWFDEISSSITEENSAIQCNCGIRITNGSSPKLITMAATAMVANNVIITKFPDTEFFTLPAGYYLELNILIIPIKTGTLPTSSDMFITNFSCELEYPI